VSKERARRRAEREAETAQRAAERAKREAETARRRAVRDRLARVLPAGTKWSRSAGPLASRRRKTFGLMLFGFFVVQLLTFVSTPDWGLRAAVFVVSLFAVPVITVLVAG